MFFCTKRLKADYPAPLNPYCGNDAYGYSGVKNYGHFQPCTSAVKAKDILYYNKPPSDRGPLLSEWANCSAVIPPDTLVLPAVQINGDDFFSQTAVSRDYARTNWQPYQWSDYYQKNFKQGPECVQAMRLYWCMDALGVADPRGDFNTYGLIPCPSVCEYVFRSCNAYNKSAKYMQDYFSGCFTPGDNPYSKWFDNPNGPPRACFTENLTVTLPNCTSQLGYECLNGGKWHSECLGCICPPGFGGYNCGRCSISGRSFPGSYTRTLSKDQSPTALANSACKSMGFDSQCTEYTDFGNYILPDNAQHPPVYECGVSLENKYPLSVMAGGYVTISIDVREKDLKFNEGSLYFYISTTNTAWTQGYASNRDVLCNATNCTQASSRECKANGVPVHGDDTKGDSCFHCVYAGCNCVSNSVTNALQGNRAKCGVRFSINLLITPNP